MVATTFKLRKLTQVKTCGYQFFIVITFFKPNFPVFAWNCLKLRELKRLFYIAVHKGKAPFEIEENISFKTIREDKNKWVKIEIKRYEIEDEIYLLCQSEKKQRKKKV